MANAQRALADPRLRRARHRVQDIEHVVVLEPSAAGKPLCILAQAVLAAAVDRPLERGVKGQRDFLVGGQQISIFA
ncbi:MAG: hypothetical protein ACP5VP_12210, partial [Candidatus Limnocylindrales bacterium]